MMTRNQLFWTCVVGLITSVTAFSQTRLPAITRTLEWEAGTLNFKGAMFAGTLPVFGQNIPLENYGELSIADVEFQYETIQHPLLEKEVLQISTEIVVQAKVSFDRRKPVGTLQFLPFRKQGRGFERVTSFTIRPQFRAKPTPLNRGTNAPSSELSNGDIYKISVSEDGVYKLDYNFLKTTLGITNLDNIDPRKIRLLGNGGGMLPEMDSIPRPADVLENAIFVSGEADGRFDSGDFILFYGQSPDEMRFDTLQRRFYYTTNFYTEQNFYFIKIGNEIGKRISDRASIPANYASTGVDAIQHYEKDDWNLLRKELDGENSHATGRELYDKDIFKYNPSRSYSMDFANFISSEPVKMTVRFASRCVGSSSYSVKVNGTNRIQASFAASSGDALGIYAQPRLDTANFTTTSGTMAVEIATNFSNSSGIAWLDYFTLHARTQLGIQNGQTIFRDYKTRKQPTASFSLSTLNPTIWDITEPTNIVNQSITQTTNGSLFGYTPENKIHEFIAFDGTTYKSAVAIGKIQNQNLRAATVPDLLIVYHPDFSAAATTLANHRRSFNNFEVLTVTPAEIYNEFSSGKQDVAAIRDFAKHLYDQNLRFKYLLFLGNASFDYRHKYSDEPDRNFVPTYETIYSSDPVSSYQTDDFFALLDDNEGNPSAAFEKLDIAVGRLTVNNATNANEVVNKIIRYDTDISVRGEWINRLDFIADDEDGVTHISQANSQGDILLGRYPRYNMEKIYLDAYPQTTAAGGQRYPVVNEIINQDIYKGNLIMNYVGHGGPEGWAQERVLTLDQINAWRNTNAYPLFITASCSNAHFDDPLYNSMAEVLLQKEDGGAIALYSAVRAVYPGANAALTKAVFDTIFTNEIGTYQPPRIGEILRIAKNKNPSVENTRKFHLLGDPSQHLSMPEYGVRTTKINGNPVTNRDTLGALEAVTLEGEIVSLGANPMLNESVNGTIYITIYDKEQTIPALRNDAGSGAYSFKTRNNIIFKGLADVVNGRFQCSFVVPADIGYDYGVGKISYYAKQHTLAIDAADAYYGIIVGGAAANAVQDNEPPKVKILLNDDKFAFGGLVNEKPLLLVNLSDDFGINTSGAGVGHGITAILDNNTAQAQVLNDFYEAERNNARRGTVRFPMAALAEGKHTLTVKAFDISNKSGEDYTEFIVAKTSAAALDHVLNYPNPFTTQTEFQFEHNLIGQDINVQVQVFTVTGTLVKTIQEKIFATGNRITGIRWDGKDDYGDQLAKGVYLYKVSLRNGATDGEKKEVVSNWEKLVILK